jgi:hypothetical protein
MEMQSKVATMLGGGIAIGVALGIFNLVLMLPVSWMMNQNIHHDWRMRIVAGIIGLFGFLFIDAYLLVQWVLGWGSTEKAAKYPYFGFLPLIQIHEGEQSGFLSEPFAWIMNKGKYVASLEKGNLLLPRGSPDAVNETLVRSAITLAGVRNLEEWKKGWTALTAPTAQSLSPAQTLPLPEAPEAVQ